MKIDYHASPFLCKVVRLWSWISELTVKSVRTWEICVLPWCTPSLSSIVCRFPSIAVRTPGVSAPDGVGNAPRSYLRNLAFLRLKCANTTTDLIQPFAFAEKKTVIVRRFILISFERYLSGRGAPQTSISEGWVVLLQSGTKFPLPKFVSYLVVVHF